QNKHIVIKPADKGSSVVIMDRTQYLEEGYRQLLDTKYYTKLDKPIFLDTVPLVTKIITSLLDKKFINYKQKHYLLGSSTPRARIFYMLPKIHKDPDKWSVPHLMAPGRPISVLFETFTLYCHLFDNMYTFPLNVLSFSYTVTF
uniref:Uncharacterized protein n=1 Tax=Scophthalmus maximus TaxID=52904 RepID=A0A8D3BX45_SCOMX